MILVFLEIMTYLIEVYTIYPAWVLAGTSIVRYIFLASCFRYSQVWCIVM